MAKRRSTKSSSTKVRKNAPGIGLATTADQTPDFYRIDGLVFQEFCREIIALDNNVQSCDQHGRPGKADHGVDLIAPLKGSSSCWVVQCKARRSFSKGQIKAVSNRFFKFWDSKWQKWGVKKFILIVGSNLSDTAQQNALFAERKRFTDLGIEYEWWSDATIVTKLQPHRHIVQKYLGPHAESWADSICGKQIKHQSVQDADLGLLLSVATDRLAEAISNETTKLLDDATRQWREGNTKDAITAVSDLQTNSARWTQLDSKTKADILIVHARLCLEEMNDPKAEELINKAAELGTFSSVYQLRSLIALRRGDVGQAEKELNHCSEEETFVQRLSILLNCGKADQALSLIGKMKSESKSIDLLRLKALTMILNKNVSSALATIDECLALEPKWKYSRLASAIIRYYTAVSPVEIPNSLPSWPVPIDWSVVKDTEESRTRLDESVVELRRLLSQRDLQPEEKKNLEGWLIASLCNNSLRQEEAFRLCEQLIKDDPCHEPAIGWSIARKLKIDLSASERILKELAHEKSISTDQIISLLLIFISQNRFEHGHALLNEQKGIFEGKHSAELWKYWKLQLLILEDKWQEITDEHGGLSAIPESLLPVVRTKSEQLSLVSEINDEILHGRYLLDVCTIKASDDDWTFVAKLAERLVTEVQTQQSLRIGALSLFAIEEWKKCTELLENNITLFGKVLPPDLQLLKAECLQHLGLINTALETAERAALGNPNTQNLLRHSKLLAETGNLPALIGVVKRLASQKDLTGVQAIKLCELIYRDDKTTAKQLWRKATSQQLKGENVFLAISLGYQLGLEKEPKYSALITQLNTQAESNSRAVKKVTLDEVKEVIQKQREKNKTRATAYEECGGPSHLLFNPAIQYYEAIYSAEKQFSLVKCPVTFSFHEDRLFWTGFPQIKPTWRLHVDITAILLATQFGFLDNVIKDFSPIVIPQETIPTLSRYRHELQIMPDKKRTAIEALLNAKDTNKIKIIECVAAENGEIDDAFDAHAKRDGGWLVDFEEHANNSDITVTCIAVLESLRQQGVLSSGEIEDLRSTLAKLTVIDEKRIPAIGSKLFAHTTLLEQLAMEGVLEQILTNFEVHVPSNDMNFVEREASGDKSAQELHGWLTRLIEQLNTYLQEDKVLVMPLSRAAADAHTDFAFECMCSLVKHAPKEMDVLWIDDRFINRHSHQENGAPIVTSWEILKGLAVKSITLNDYFRILLKMRSANIRYIPIESEEIIYHLNQAAIQDGLVRETNQLRTVKEYMATCLAQEEMLHKHQQTKGPVGFATYFKHQLLVALKRIWLEEIEIKTKIARSEWLVENLFADPTSLSTLSFGAAKLPNIAVIASELLFVALVIRANLGEDEASNYLNWLSRRLLNPLFNRESGLINELVSFLKQTVSALIPEGSSEEARYQIALLRWWYLHLPPVVKDEALKDTELMSKLGIAYRAVAKIFGLTLEIDSLERAINNALSSNEEQILESGIRSAVKLTAQLLQNERLAITLIDTERQFSIYDDEVQILFNKPLKRQRSLLENAQWVDVIPDRLQEIANNLSYLEPASARSMQLNRWRDDSLLEHYSELESLLRNGDRFYVDDLLAPSVESILNHYGMSSCETIPLSSYAKVLLSSDIVKFVEFIGGLPIVLADELLEEIKTKPTEEIRLIVKQLLKSKTPISKIQLLKILGLFSSSSSFLKLRERVLKGMLRDDCLGEFKAFIALLRWISNRFSGWVSARTLTWETRLALIWLHASRLFDIFSKNKFDKSWVAERFDVAQKLISVMILDVDSEVKNDISCPEMISPERLLFSGLVYSLGWDYVKTNNDIINLAVTKLEDTYWPQPSMLYSSWESNRLSSFLEFDTESPAAQVSSLQALSPKTFKQLALDALNYIRDGKESHFWWLILWHVARWPVHSSEISQGIQKLVAEKGFEKLVSESKLSFVPMVVASTHCAESSELQEAILQDLRTLASQNVISLVKDDSPEMSENGFHVGLAEAGLALSKTNDRGQLK